MKLNRRILRKLILKEIKSLTESDIKLGELSGEITGNTFNKGSVVKLYTDGKGYKRGTEYKEYGIVLKNCGLSPARCSQILSHANGKNQTAARPIKKIIVIKRTKTSSYSRKTNPKQRFKALSAKELISNPPGRGVITQDFKSLLVNVGNYSSKTGKGYIDRTLQVIYTKKGNKINVYAVKPTAVQIVINYHDNDGEDYSKYADYLKQKTAMPIKKSQLTNYGQVSPYNNFEPYIKNAMKTAHGNNTTVSYDNYMSDSDVDALLEDFDGKSRTEYGPNTLEAHEQKLLKLSKYRGTNSYLSRRYELWKGALYFMRNRNMGRRYIQNWKKKYARFTPEEDPSGDNFKIMKDGKLQFVEETPYNSEKFWGKKHYQTHKKARPDYVKEFQSEYEERQREWDKKHKR